MRFLCDDLAVLNKSWKQHPKNSSRRATYLPSHKPSIKKNMTCGVPSHKRCSRMDSYTWTHQSWPIGKDYIYIYIYIYIYKLCVATKCSLEDLEKAIDYRDRWRESRVIPCCQSDLIMMMMMMMIFGSRVLMLLTYWCMYLSKPSATVRMGYKYSWLELRVFLLKHRLP